jgi:hypothetical protein
MSDRRVVRKRIRIEEPGINIDADINIMTATNVGEKTVTRVASKKRAASRSGKAAPPKQGGDAQRKPRTEDPDRAT